MSHTLILIDTISGAGLSPFKFGMLIMTLEGFGDISFAYTTHKVFTIHLIKPIEKAILLGLLDEAVIIPENYDITYSLNR